ncbi:MAG: amino acid permease [Hyphomonas sp.]|nr:amino acid permease [Hyphomonas sp.]
MNARPAPASLKRELGVFGATMLGLGSILGTGIFVSIGIATGAAGPAVILSIALAALLATCNALSSAQLAAAHPVSGGAYEYGYRLLRSELGFTAGWMFLSAKSACAATAALGAAGYAFHLAGLDGGNLLRWAGFAIAILLTLLVLGGLRRSSAANIIIVWLSVLALGAFAVAGFLQLPQAVAGGQFTPFLPQSDSIGGLLYATALMFVAYTGYGRVATMSEEVVEPRQTIPRAIIATLIVSALLYIAVALAAIGAVGAEALSGAAGGDATPLETAARALEVPGLALPLALGAVTAMLGVLLNLILGLSRVALAMGRRGDLPPALGQLDAQSTPRAAVLLVGAAIAGLALIGDVKTTWSFSAFTVLIYYAITNLAALRLPKDQRLYPRWISMSGLAGCLGLTVFIPLAIWVAGLALLLGGLAWRWLALRWGPTSNPNGDKNS